MKNFKPILFSSAMVEAILEARKTKTRRTHGLEKINESPGSYRLIDYGPAGVKEIRAYFSNTFGDRISVKPKYQIGEVMWVRETFCTPENWDHWPPASIPKGVPLNYKADQDNDHISKFLHKGKWRSSIHMPKSACRIFLEVTNVRVERLQDINEEDAKAEGIQFYFEELFQENRYRDYNKKLQAGYGDPAVDYPTRGDPISSFKSLWQFINGWESWNKNPWVWVYDFKRVEKPENFLS